jgi:hypothetical protein
MPKAENTETAHSAPARRRVLPNQSTREVAVNRETFPSRPATVENPANAVPEATENASSSDSASERRVPPAVAVSGSVKSSSSNSQVASLSEPAPIRVQAKPKRVRESGWTWTLDGNYVRAVRDREALEEASEPEILD